jgi:hypothetical protein
MRRTMLTNAAHVCAEALERRVMLAATPVVYVDASSTATAPDGSSWQKAYKDLQSALAAVSGGGDILMTGGNYSAPTTDVPANVEIDGGYAGAANAANPASRNVAVYKTLLGAVSTSDPNGALTLDGIDFVGPGNPNAVATGITFAGGALVARDCTFTKFQCAVYFSGNGSLTLSSCQFKSNSNREGGTAVAFPEKFPQNTIDYHISDCTFIDNSVAPNAFDLFSQWLLYLPDAATGGAITNCTFEGNTDAPVYAANDVAITNCQFIGNQLAIVLETSKTAESATIVNCTFAANQDVFSNPYKTPVIVSNCVFSANSQTFFSTQASAYSFAYCDMQATQPGAGNISVDPQFIRNPSRGSDGNWGTADDDFGDLHLQKTSPCIDAGDNSAVPSGVTTDIARSPRFFDVASATDSGNGTVPIVDIGAYEAQFVPLTPLAKAGGPYALPEGGSVTLDGSQSSEAGGSIVSYQWDFNYNGSTFNGTATGKTASFSAAGLDGPSTRTIALKVTDGSGKSAIATATVKITDAPPTAKLTGGTVTLGSAGKVAFSSQADPSPADMTAGFKYSYDFNNDGTFEITDSSSASATVPATYLAIAGNHTIRGRIKDKDGGFTDYTTTIAVTAPTKASISGMVFADNNGNAKLDAGEAAVSGRKLYIDKNKNGVLDAGEPVFTTGANGAFTFSGLAAGTYRVRDLLPSGWRRTSPTAGYFDISVAAGQSITGKNFAETTRGLISGAVFKDANGNGVKDSTEVGLSGWVVYLDTNNNGKVDAGEISFSTGSDGKFSFVVPAGTYHLREVLKSGFKRTAPSTGVYNITLSSGQSATGKNFGDK